MRFYLGLDGGGSHTRVRLVSVRGETVGAGHAGSANSPRGPEAASAALAAACDEACREAGIGFADRTHIAACFGVAGLERHGVLAAIRAHDYGFGALAVLGDAEIAAIGAHGGGDGAIVSVGTGSIGFARVAGEAFTVGGFGFPVSDEGSGAELGLRAIRRALWARDGRIAPSALTDAILSRFGGSAIEIIDWTLHAAPSDYAALAPLVIEQAERGDVHAATIVSESALRLSRLIAVMLDRGLACCLLGGLAGPLRRWLPAEIDDALRDPLGDALDGALLHARTLGG